MAKHFFGGWKTKLSNGRLLVYQRNLYEASGISNLLSLDYEYSFLQL